MGNHTLHWALACLIAITLAGCGGDVGEGDFEEPSLGSTSEAISQPAGTEAELWSYNNGSMTSLASLQTTREWDAVLPIKFPSKPYPSILFYDRVMGKFELRDTTGNGALSGVVRSWSGWRTTWDNVQTITNGTKVRLVLYDQTNGDLTSYSLNPDGTTGGAVTVSIGRFDLSATGRFFSSTSTGFAAYSRITGQIKFWNIDINTGALAAQTPIAAARTYDYIASGDFMGSTSRDDLVLLDRDEGDLLSVRMDGLTTRTTYDWTERFVHGIIVGGQFNAATGYDDLLFYNQEAGRGQFYYSTGSASAPFVKRPDSAKTLRTSWNRIARAKFRVCAGGCTDDLLFYEDQYVIRIRPVAIQSVAGYDYVKKVARVIAQLNLTFGQAGLQFEAAPVVAPNDPNLLPDCNEATDDSYQNQWALTNYPSELVVYLRHTPGSCSSYTGEAAILYTEAADWTIAHELGHFFALEHIWWAGVSGPLGDWFKLYCKVGATSPHPEWCNPTIASEIVAAYASTPEILDSDATPGGWLDAYDTPPHPSHLFWGVAGTNGCDTRQELYIPAASGGYWINPDRLNVMDYPTINLDPAPDMYCGRVINEFGTPLRDEYHVSPMQARLVRQDLRTLWGPFALRNRLILP